MCRNHWGWDAEIEGSEGHNGHNSLHGSAVEGLKAPMDYLDGPWS